MKHSFTNIITGIYIYIYIYIYCNQFLASKTTVILLVLENMKAHDPLAVRLLNHFDAFSIKWILRPPLRDVIWS